ncbi:TolC family protein [Phenylobacterium sp. 58.2.17]|uniref:TolC family protein n=1 Tax=Phenylobacterium sp. 58.2.17 TaxID=2969306 RepID=UPI00086F2F2F|nr:TolC family protein [Phenylobacterium sp. 58.2.17]MCX7588232.1 TolC family protein [Phenylobacterium sp. 58.2.17]ODT59295.1 MAG: transporter [Phenylobacterium sp. SCN 69-14]
MNSKFCRPPLARLLLLASLSTASAAMAEPAPPYGALLAQARISAPRLAETEADIAQAQGLARQAMVRPNPILGVELENFSGSGPYDGLDRSEATASIEQTLELGGKRSIRIAAGQAGVRAAQAQAELARAEFAAQLAVAYAEAEAAAAKVAQAEDGLIAAETDAKAARELVDAGREAELRALQAAAERDAAQAERDQAQSVRDAAFAKLSALAGSPTPFDSISESLLVRAPAVTANPDATAPAVLAARLGREAAAARVRVEARQAVPDVTISAGVRQIREDDSTAFVAGISAPLPLFDRNRGATDAARAELSAADARLRQAEFDAVADLRAAQSQARSAASQAAAASAGESAAAEAYRLARLGYEAGRLPLLELSSARRALVNARIRTLDARLALVRAEAEIARLTGRTPFGA